MRETWTLSLQSQDLIVLAAAVRVLSLQQVQAAEPDAAKHSPALVLNMSIAVLHAVILISILMIQQQNVTSLCEGIF
jgi:hypothetical protein